MGGTEPGFCWVSSEQLTRTALHVLISNPGTRTTSDSAAGTEIVELGSESLLIRVPKGVAAEGHFLSIRITLRAVSGGEVPRKGIPRGRATKTDGRLLVSVSTTGKVERMTMLEDGSLLLSVRYYQFDELAWSELVRHLDERQIRAGARLRTRQE